MKEGGREGVGREGWGVGREGEGREGRKEREDVKEEGKKHMHRNVHNLVSVQLTQSFSILFALLHCSTMTPAQERRQP